jgi:hypothetical protein
MRLHAKDVLARAAERGYSLDDVRPCLATPLGGGWYDVDVNHPSYPRRKDGANDLAANGLGDMVSSWLSSMGITESRVSGIIGKPCGCGERKAALNAAGAKWLGLPPGSTAPAEIDPGTP